MISQIVLGTIVGWVPEDGDDMALWHVRHLDGDEEDLEEHEVLKYLIEEESEEEDEGGEGGAVGAASSSQSGASVGAGGAGVGGGGGGETVAAAKSVTQEEEEEEPEPQIVLKFPSAGRGYSAVKPYAIGLAGLETELLRALQSVLPALKKSPQVEYSKEKKSSWEVREKGC